MINITQGVPYLVKEGPRLPGSHSENGKDMTSQLFERWRHADAVARAAEMEVLTASLEALDGKGSPPSCESQARARSLRVAADAMLNGALSSLRMAAERADTFWPEGSKPTPGREAA